MLSVGGLLSASFAPNALACRELIIVFFISVLVKALFLFLWTFYKVGFFDPNYLQFPDEHKYLEFQGGLVFNIYYYIVFWLQGVGFGIFTLKFLNIVVASLSAARVYSIVFDYRLGQGWVSVSIIFLYVVSPMVAYFSSFVLREAFMFFLLSEIFVRLMRPHQKGFHFYVPVLIGFLSLFRTEFLLLFIIYFWRLPLSLRFFSYMSFGVIFGVFASDLIDIYSAYVRMGFYYNVAGGESSGTSILYSGFVLSASTLASVFAANFSSAFLSSPTSDVLIFIFHWSIYIPIILLASDQKTRAFFPKYKDIWAPLLLMCFCGLITFFNFRYFAVLAQFIVLALIASGGDARNFTRSRGGAI